MNSEVTVVLGLVILLGSSAYVAISIPYLANMASLLALPKESLMALLSLRGYVAAAVALACAGAIFTQGKNTPILIFGIFATFMAWLNFWQAARVK